MYIKPKKRLGQNFLVDKNIQSKIIAALELNPDDTVLEIGAGRGEFTCLIARLVKKVYALEIDKYLCPVLENNCQDFPNIKIVNGDILKFNLSAELKNIKAKIKVFGNIPYYISSPIIEHLLNERKIISSIYLTVQKEFAERVVATPGSKDFGSLSCFVQFYSCPKIMLNISKNSFFPAPKVDSSLLRMDIFTKKRLNKSAEEMLFKITRAAFNKRRKTLRNSLDEVVPMDKLNDFFTEFKINPNTRPECLSLNDFINLAKSQSF